MYISSVVGARPFVNLMNIMDEKDGGDSELLVYAMTLINKVIHHFFNVHTSTSMLTFLVQSLFRVPISGGKSGKVKSVSQAQHFGTLLTSVH